MKRLKFSQSMDKKKLYTNDIFCMVDFYVGEIELNEQIQWFIYDSERNIVDKGISTSVSYAQQAIKKALMSLGGNFDKEHRKYKI